MRAAADTGNPTAAAASEHAFTNLLRLKERSSNPSGDFSPGKIISPLQLECAYRDSLIGLPSACAFSLTHASKR
jgi:hypothetical protein